MMKLKRYLKNQRLFLGILLLTTVIGWFPESLLAADDLPIPDRPMAGRKRV